MNSTNDLEKSEFPCESIEIRKRGYYENGYELKVTKVLKGSSGILNADYLNGQGEFPNKIALPAVS
jgi:hypothetical protein